MKLKNVFLFIIFSSFFYSCSSKKNIIYLQDIKTNTNYSIDYEEYIIKPDDILKIEVNSEVPEAALVVNPNAITNYNNNRESFLLNGYQVNSKGYINFPKIGKIQASGYSIREFRDSIEFKIKEEDLKQNNKTLIDCPNLYPHDLSLYVKKVISKIFPIVLGYMIMKLTMKIQVID